MSHNLLSGIPLKSYASFVRGTDKIWCRHSLIIIPSIAICKLHCLFCILKLLIYYMTSELFECIMHESYELFLLYCYCVWIVVRKQNGSHTFQNSYSICLFNRHQLIIYPLIMHTHHLDYHGKKICFSNILAK